jgi:cytochrome c oxidase cbb3-type subunit 3
MASIPDFTRHDWHKTRSDERLIRSVREGNGAMPAMKRKLSEAEVMRLVSLVRNFGGGGQIVDEDLEFANEGPSPSTVTEKPIVNSHSATATAPIESQTTTKPASSRPEAGRRLFARFCVACHGADGHGSSMRSQVPLIPDFTSSTWQETRSDVQLSITILEGKGTVMPTFMDRLDEPAARSVVAYLRTFAARPMIAPDAPSTEFRQRIRRLQMELEDLRRQTRALLVQ